MIEIFQYELPHYPSASKGVLQKFEIRFIDLGDLPKGNNPFRDLFRLKDQGCARVTSMFVSEIIPFVLGLK
jgi:hypothetical protein